MWGTFIDAELIRAANKMTNNDDRQQARQAVLEALLSDVEGQVVLPGQKEFAMPTMVAPQSNPKPEPSGVKDPQQTGKAGNSFRDPASLFNKG